MRRRPSLASEKRTLPIGEGQYEIAVAVEPSLSGVRLSNGPGRELQIKAAVAREGAARAARREIDRVRVVLVVSGIRRCPRDAAGGPHVDLEAPSRVARCVEPPRVAALD